MIKKDYIEVELTNRNFKKLSNLYNIPNTYKVGDIYKIPIELLSTGSNFKIDISCDYCGIDLVIKYKVYNKYTNIINKYSCSKKECSNQKIKDVCQAKYGVDNPFQSEFVKEKSKQTFLEKYGVEHQMQIEQTKEKIRKTNLERYGVENVTQSFEFKEKSKKTCLEKYGFEYSLQSEEVREKGKKTNLEKYGFEHSQKSSEVRKKTIKTCLDKWGFKTNLQSEESKEKIKQTNLERYGVESVMQSEEVRKLHCKMANNPNYISYVRDKISLFKCNKGHEFEISSDNYISSTKNNLTLCTICNPIGDSSSLKENELFGYIKSIYSTEVKKYKDKLEIDIYLPELNLGFEFNGLYWHSEGKKDRDYHLNKTKYFEEKGIRIIHIWEDDWIYKNDIVKSQVRNLLGLSNKIYARKCQVREVDTKDDRIFLDNNHIQGFVNSNIKIGLYYNNELVSLMTFDKFEGRKKLTETEYNLNRFCNKIGYSIIGGASKLLKYFIDTYQPTRIISYADRDWSIGNLYEKLGFEMLYKSKPDYKYVVTDKRIHKSNYKKSKTGISEAKLNLLKIYDCGKMKFELKIKSE